MDVDYKVLPKAFRSYTSSRAVSIPENGHTDDTSKDRQYLQEFMQSCPKKESARSNINKERKHSQPSKCKSTEEFSKASGTNGCKNSELKKFSDNSTSANNHEPPRKQPRKADHPLRLPSSTEGCPDFGLSNSWICKNSACKAVLTSEDTFCKRCSCCICHLFDDNKDPSLWLVCASEFADRDWCGMSCHIDCALQRQKAGVVDLGQFLQLDGSYCCASCGKVSGIIGCWKKQLVIAKDARRLDVLCYRISLSYRLLDGTSRFEELHGIVEEAKSKLETEVGPVSGVSAKMARGIVSRLSVAGDVQNLCALAIEKADEWLSSISQSDAKHIDSLPVACKFVFEEITSSSVVIVLKDTSLSASNVIKGYKLWYFKGNELPYKRDPVIFLKTQRRVLVSNLQPCTEYIFRIISFTEDGDFGHSESKCFTKSVEIIYKKTERNGAGRCSSTAKKECKTSTAGSAGFRVRNLGKIVRLAWAQEEGCFDGLYQDDMEEFCDGNDEVKQDTSDDDQAEPAVACLLDLNVMSVPDLNADLTTPLDSSPDDNNGCSSEKNGDARSNRSGDSQTCAVRPLVEVPAVESRPDCRKRLSVAHEETYDGDSTLVDSSPLRFSNGSGPLDDKYEYSVKIIRWLECTGHIEKDFRMKFLTWFSLRSTEQDRRVVITFIRTLIGEPSSLAGQLLDSFSEIVTCKRPRNGFCSKLWH